MSKIKHFGLLSLAAALMACSPTGKKAAVPKLTETGTPVLHAIDNDELRLLMDRMNSLMFERNLTELELDSQRRAAVSKVSAAARDLEQAIDGILAAEPKLSLDEGEKKVFRSLATNLKGEAQTLKAQADAHQVDAIPVTLEKMSATCTSCHELFRDFNKPGVQK